jgi:hypothetical protein
MGKYHGKDARLYIGGYDISALAVALGISQEIEQAEYAVMDGVDGYHSLPGLAKDALSLEGVFDDDNMTVLNNLFSASSGYQIIIPFGTSQGDRGMAVNAARLQKYLWPSKVTELNRISGELIADTLPWDEIKMLQEAATKTADGNSNSIDESAASSDGAKAYLQIWELGANDTLQVKIQESSDDAVADPWADLITFTTLDGSVNTETTERLTVSGAVERYLRVVWTFGGTSPYTAKFCVGWKRN